MAEQYTAEDVVDALTLAEALRPFLAAKGGPVSFTPESLRAAVVDGCDRVLGAPWVVQRFISDDQRRILRAQREFWKFDTTGQVNRLLELVNKEP